LLKPEWETLRKGALALEGCNGSDEDVLTFAMFPQVAPKFFKSRSAGPKNVGRDPQPGVQSAPAGKTNGGGQISTQSNPVTYVVTLEGKEHKVTVSPAK
jgi:methylmalonyl-CoA carboxyltransferase 5S subunit